MFARESDALKNWKELVSHHSQRNPVETVPSGGDRLLTCLDWSEQPPKKRTKRVAAVATSSPQQPQQPCYGGQSHKVVEKRRRDRMNQALNSLSRLIPAAYLRQGQSRVEKAEIIELAAQHLLELSWQLRKSQAALNHSHSHTDESVDPDCCLGKFYLGFCESSKSALSFLTDQEGFSTTDTLCCRLRSHLHTLSQKHLPASTELLPTFDQSKCQRQKQKRQQKQPSAPGYGSCSSSDEAPASCGSCSSSGDEMVDRAGGACKSSVAAAVHREDEEEQLLPGFVLHESGTHYLPLVVPPSALGTELCRTAGPEGISQPQPQPQPVGEGMGDRKRKQVEQQERPQPLLHPVSIPVNFQVTRFVATPQKKR